jgi:hypothetical protein
MVAGINDSKPESRLQAAGMVKEKAETPVIKEEKPVEVVKDNIIKVNFNESVKNVRHREPQNIMESEEYLDQIEGEVYNDRGKVEKKVIGESNKEADEILSIVFNKEDLNSDIRNRSEKKEEQKVNTDYIEDTDSFKEESDTPEEVKEEDLFKFDDTWSKEKESYPIYQDIPETAEAAGFGFADQDYGYMNLLNETSEELFNNSGLQPEDIASQYDVSSESCLEEPVKQAFFEDHPVAKKIYQSYPRMYPFEDNEIAWCVRIEPQDIGLFPMEAWILGNNSFLLHGYYSYRHLIFARINDKNGIGYILGVPGIYHNREKFMAKMFGFENFKCAKRKAQRTGEFGYWYIPITLS